MPATEYRLSGPYTHANLTVFLVHGPETLGGASFLTLQEAQLEQKRVVVPEPDCTVNGCTIESVAGQEDVFIQSGDIVKGGKQDRTFQYDAVIGPNSGHVSITSFYVRAGPVGDARERKSSEYFSSSRSNVAHLPKDRRAATLAGRVEPIGGVAERGPHPGPAQQETGHVREGRGVGVEPSAHSGKSRRSKCGRPVPHGVDPRPAGPRRCDRVRRSGQWAVRRGRRVRVAGAVR